ncbi:SusC/RagA family TonB-linked outer membrane protein [Niabella beijingensis]|uniref:SusC/RagA family TonB-linked outer membrane protein n=1 Tax=Niabella beijingensis TaxID=2872700 RepID=UPI001CBEDE83|nr:SusC/RagA family TonB-linked outer membrane protein [Niabella beijingensis]
MRRLFAASAVTLLLLFPGMIHAQTKAVSGRVTDSGTGQPLPGVTISVVGRSLAVLTDSAGSYRIFPGAATGTLEFSSVGYVSQKIRITGDQLDVSLVPEISNLENVVVIGYGTARKKDLTGSLATVNADDFQKGNITTPDQLIAGKVAGVAITPNGGRPGSGSTIRIRGGSSLNASNDPLIVIDGVPVDNGSVSGAASPLSFINPNDIESFTILKDASASAIYGARANNGVLLITTKKGKSGAFKASYGTTNSVAVISKTIDVLTGEQIRAIVEEFGTTKQKAQLGTASTNWQKEIYRAAFASDNNLTLSGGIKNFPYRLSLGFLNQDGILKTDNLKRTSIGLALNPTFFNNHLKVDLNIKSSFQKTRFANSDAIGAAVTFDPTQATYMEDQTYGGYYQWTEPNGKLVLNRANNPVGLLEQTFDNQKPMRSIGNLQVDYKFHFLPELRANINVGYDISRNNGTKFIPNNAASNYVIDSAAGGGLYQESKQERNNTLLDAYLNYTKKLMSIKSRIDATVGYSYNNFRAKNYNFRSLNANRDTLSGSTAPVFSFDIPENTLISYWGRLLYNFDEKYYLTASLRRDGSSRYSPENRWGWFPSIGLAWSLKNEFFKNSTELSDLRLRFGYGSTGQQDGIGNYDYLARYGVGGLSGSYEFGDAFYNGVGPFGYNAGLKWEKLQSYNLALDYGFADNRVSGSIEFYIRKTQDLLNAIPQAAGTNFSAYILANVGDLTNKGIEFTLNTQPIRTATTTLEVNFNYAYNHNNIEKLTVNPDSAYMGVPTGGAEGASDQIMLHAIGHPRSTFFLYQQVYDANGQPLEGVFVDRNNDGIINAADKYLNHSAVPDHTFGLSTNLTIKNWSAGFVARASLNNYVYNNIYSKASALNVITGNYIIGNASKNYLNTKFTGGTDLQPLSDLWVENASFLRMDNLFIGYNFGKIRGIYSLRATAGIQNVFIITKYKGLDPELSGGTDNNLYPRPRIFSLSLNLDF